MNDFSSKNAFDITRALSEFLVEVIRRDNPLVADRLAVLRDAVWPERASEKHHLHSTKEAAFDTALKGLDQTQKSQLIEAYARMGHLYDIAALQARENCFNELRKERGRIPGGIKAFIDDEKNRDLSIGDLVEKLNQPVFEAVMTMHPTITCSLDSIKSQRALAKALDACAKVKKEDGEESFNVQKTNLQNAITAFQHTPLLHRVGNKEANFTLRDETDIVLNFLSNIYEDIPIVYERYDQRLREKGGDNYKPLDLDLKLRLGSWGSSGDKDGNLNVTAETTLEAIALHTQTIIELYRKDLPPVPELREWRDRLDIASAALTQLLPQIVELRKNSDHTRNPEQYREGQKISAGEIERAFETLSAQLAEIRDGDKVKGTSGLNAGQFEADLTSAYKASGDKSVLDLIRRVRIFGFNLSKIEYRETARAYSRVVEKIVHDYPEEAEPGKRVEKLTHLLNGGEGPLSGLLDEAKNRLTEGAAQKYGNKNALPIAYHTLKRMQLARDFPDMIQDNVLAECGQIKNSDSGQKPSAEEVKAQGLANMLEALLLQKVVEKNGKWAQLGIVPLFEEPDTMDNVDKILDACYSHDIYRQHLGALAAQRHYPKETQQVQIAHSDNTRRAGKAAALGSIHEAHKKIRAVNEKHGIQTQFFEGGSLSDVYRNGVRSISRLVDDFEMHDFAKFTFQGGDLLNYFNVPASTVRMFTRHFAHPAERFTKQDDGTWQVTHRHRPLDKVMDDLAIAALKRTRSDYQTEDFTDEAMGILLAALKYDREKAAGTRGSRSGHRGEVPMARAGKRLQPVDIKDARTISFSEKFQQDGILPTWVGAQNLHEYLSNRLTGKGEGRDGVDEARQFHRAFEDAHKELLKQRHAATTPKLKAKLEEDIADCEMILNQREHLTPKHIQLFHKHSAAWKNLQDCNAFAFGITDPHAMRMIKTYLEKPDSLDSNIDADTKESIKKGREYLRKIIYSYGKVGNLVHASFEGARLAQRNPTLEPTDPKFLKQESVQPAIRKILPMPLAENMEHKSSYRDFLLYVKHNDGLSDHDLGVIHNAGDTVLHGRWPSADDPHYGKHCNNEMKLSSPVPNTAGDRAIGKVQLSR